ncbi:MAG: 1,4-dihydroxy-2-naphthoate octaprenyltransferase [Elusimicrobiota bacterium]
MTESNKLTKYLKVSRANFFLSSLIPGLVSVSVAIYQKKDINWYLLPVVFLGILSVHAMTNLVNEYYDYKKGIDNPSDTGEVHLLSSGRVSLGEVRILIIISLFLCLGCAVLLSFYRGVPFFLFCIAGILAGYSYTGPPLEYKYQGFGDIMIFLFMGPMLVGGAYYALTGIISKLAIYASFPQGILIAAVLNSNNIRDIDKDRATAVKTLPVIIGVKRAKIIYSFLIYAAFAWPVFLALAGLVPLTTLLILIFLPYAVKANKVLKEEKKDAIGGIDLMTLKVYVGVNMVLVLSVLFGRFI